MLNLIENDPCVVMVYFRYLLYLNSEYDIINHLTYSRDLREGLQSDSPFIRVKKFINNKQDTSYFLGLYKANIIKQSYAMSSTFKDWFTEAIIIMHVLNRGKAVADDNSLYFRMASHEETDKLGNKEAWEKATMYRWTGKSYNYLSYPMTYICDIYNLAKTMSTDPSAPENFTRDILDISLKRCAPLFRGRKIVDDNMVPRFPEKEELYKEVFGIVSKYYQNRRIFKTSIFLVRIVRGCLRRTYRLLKKIFTPIMRRLDEV
jgi:hypothetical protein